MGRRNAFYSFHYDLDNWRASQVRNMGVVDGNHPVSDNDWEQVKKGGDAAIERWIENQMSGRSCVVVLIGNQTSNRKWVLHEISKGWNLNKGVVGIYVHNLRDALGRQVGKGASPFSKVTHNPTKLPLSSIVKTYDPPFFDSQQVYAYIKNNVGTWIEEAIRIRTNY